MKHTLFLTLTFFASFSYATSRCWEETANPIWHEVLFEEGSVAVHRYDDRLCDGPEVKACKPVESLFLGSYQEIGLTTGTSILLFGRKMFLFSETWSELYKFNKATESYELLAENMFCED